MGDGEVSADPTNTAMRPLCCKSEGYAMTDQPKPDPQDADFGAYNSFKNRIGILFCNAVNGVNGVISNKCGDLTIAREHNGSITLSRRAAELLTVIVQTPTPDATEGARLHRGSVKAMAYASHVPPKPAPAPEPSPFVQRLNEIVAEAGGTATPKPTPPDAMREALKRIIEQAPESLGNKNCQCTVCVVRRIAETALIAPVPPADGAIKGRDAGIAGAIFDNEGGKPPPSGTRAAEPVAVCPSCGWRFHPEVATPPVRGDREAIADYRRHWWSFFHGWTRSASEPDEALEAAERAKLFDPAVHRVLSLPVQSTARPDKEAAAQIIAKRMFGEKLEDLEGVTRDNCRDTVTEIFELAGVQAGAGEREMPSADPANELAFGMTVSDEQIEEVETILSNPLPPTATILQGQKLLRKLRETDSDLCAGGVDPGWDECPKCGATMDDECRGGLSSQPPHSSSGGERR